MPTITHVDARVAAIETRLPFRYGIAEMTRAPHVMVQVRLRTEHGEHDGWASEHLPPKWFIKDAALPFPEEARQLAEAILDAAEQARGLTAPDVFQLSRRLDRLVREHAPTDRSGLVTGLGVSLIERATIDAWCRAEGLSFSDALDTGALGFDAAAIHPELTGLEHRRAARRTTIAVRHTVGLADPLTDADVEFDPGDGLPVSVESAIRASGVTHFKLKTSGEADADIDRVVRLLEVCRSADIEPRFTIDGNESMHTADALVSWIDTLWSEPRLAEFRDRLDAVEQPLHRSVAVGEAAADALAEVGRLAPIIIDESDDDEGTVRRAMDLGYAGGTYKGCKGVFRGLANAALVEHRRRPDRRTVITAEDLSTVPPLTVAQDLVVASAMGLGHIERNGHHYFARFAPLGDDLPGRCLAAHPDLYRHDGAGVRLRIVGGMLDVTSALAAPFGTAPEPDISPAAALTPESAARIADGTGAASNPT